MKVLDIVVFATIAVLAAAPVYAQNDQNRKDTQAAAAEAAKAFADTPVEEVAPPKPKYWTKSLRTDLKFNQQKLNNWAAGGINNITLNTYIDGRANYAKNKMYWNNRVMFDYGFIYQEDKPFIQKNIDRIYLESKYGYSKSAKFGFSTKFDLLSQFTNSYNYVVPTDFTGDSPTSKDWKKARTLKSGFFSPATFHVGAGMDWIPNPQNKWLVVNFQPLTGGFVIVDNELLRKAYGMHRVKKYKDESAFPYQETMTDGSVLTHGEYYKASRFELGAQLQADLNLKINTNFTYAATLILFSNYLDKPQNMRVNLTNRVNWLLAKYLTFSFTSFLIYDDHVMIKNPDDIDKYPEGKQRVQLQELLGFGFTYTFPVAKK
jgi:Protein of unknown function (DUF3078).